MQYQLIRSKRKTLALEVTAEGQLLVRAPIKTSLKVIEKFVEDHAVWIERARAKQEERRKLHPPLAEDEIKRLRTLAKEKIPPRVAYFADVMGVKPTSVRITSAKKRFGSCSPKNALCFSLYLMQYPDDAVDYVVVHELAHILHHDHSARFWSTVARYMPDYKRRRALLKE